jgi:hypothetical protein
MPDHSSLPPRVPLAKREELARLAGRAATRVVAHQHKSEWSPTTVVNPADDNGQVMFISGTEWNYIRDLLVTDESWKPVTLNDGKTGYVLTKKLAQGTLYIKLQLGCGCVIGRSFHYSHHS